MSCGVPQCPDCECKPPGREFYEESYVPWEDVKAQAENLTAGDRRSDYGPPAENHARTATLWSAYLHTRGYPRALSPSDVCVLNVLQKLAREVHAHKDDNIVDAIGYLMNLQELEG